MTDVSNGIVIVNMYNIEGADRVIDLLFL